MKFLNEVDRFLVSVRIVARVKFVFYKIKTS